MRVHVRGLLLRGGVAAFGCGSSEEQSGEPSGSDGGATGGSGGAMGGSSSEDAFSV